MRGVFPDLTSGRNIPSGVTVVALRMLRDTKPRIWNDNDFVLFDK